MDHPSDPSTEQTPPSHIHEQPEPSSSWLRVEEASSGIRDGKRDQVRAERITAWYMDELSYEGKMEEEEKDREDGRGVERRDDSKTVSIGPDSPLLPVRKGPLERAKLAARKTWQLYLMTWSRWILTRAFMGWLQATGTLRNGSQSAELSIEIDDREKLELLLRADSDGVGPFGLARSSIISGSSEDGNWSGNSRTEMGEEKRDAAWWKAAAQLEASRNQILEANLESTKRKLKAESLKLESQLSEEQVRHQRTMRRQYKRFTEQHEVVRKEVESKYRMIDTLSGELSTAYMRVQQATDARLAGQLALSQGSSRDYLDHGIEMRPLTPRGDSADRSGIQLVAASPSPLGDWCADLPPTDD